MSSDQPRSSKSNSPDASGEGHHRDKISAAIAATFGRQPELLETHISWVFLINDTALKVKKPVDLGFCNFTTLERRRHFCHEELRLNRRLAPQIYLDVLAIWSGDGTPCLAPDDQFREADSSAGSSHSSVLDYAVRMRRFEQEQLLSKIAAAGNLQPQWFDRLAETLAAFYRQAPAAAANSEQGKPQQVWQPVEECLQSIESAANLAETQQAIGEIRAWCKKEHQQLTPWLQQRKEAGRIRECHGDLHLGNMVLLDEKIVVFDCIEFNDNLRWIDTASDLAFAIMDLQDRGAARLANRLQSAALQASEDYDALPGIVFYQVYRALVRAKVAALRFQQTRPESDERQQALAEFRNYLELAAQIPQTPQPWLAITHGLSGSGKSTAALHVVEQLGAIRIRSDVIRRRRFEDEAQRYSSAASQWTYQRMQDLAAQIIQAGFPVVVDATFLQSSERTAFSKLAQRLGVPWGIINCQAERDELRSRIAKRRSAGTDPSEADFSVLELQLRNQQALTAEEQPAVVNVNLSDFGSLSAGITQLQQNLLGSRGH